MKAIIAADEFKRLVDNTKRFTGDCKMMSYIYLEVNSEAGEIKATALDGHKVSIEYATALATESFKCYIKPNIPKITKRDRFVELELIDSKAYITVQDDIVGYIQPEGDYYNVEKLLKDLEAKEITKSIGVNPKFLIDALKSAYEGKYLSKCRIEIRGGRDPIVIKSIQGTDKNIRLVLPVTLPEGGK